ncbi:MAG TPA: heavy metal translocating P-type ATPase [Casimicrobiaceae bacterium]|nr:heavy metal translocating P-type ATPase [Casimicrobiaceae bacterium]
MPSPAFAMPAEAPHEPDARAEAANRCFHCGASNPQGAGWRATIDTVERSFCCAGCRAVAQTIHAAGLDAFYAQRNGPATLPNGADDGARSAAAAAAAGQVVALPGGEREVALLLEGIRCGACVWLIESWLARQPGVRAAAVNLATRRARVRFSAAETDLAAILLAVERIGYRAHPYDRRRREALARREGRALLRRTALALLGMMQVMMFAVPAYVTTDGIDAPLRSLLDEASLAIALPVVLYSAWPFFAGAWRDVRRLRRPGMDVPIAIGILAAFAASAANTLRGAGPVYFDSVTMFVALVLAARWLEWRMREKAGDMLEATASDVPATAQRLAGYPGSSRAETISAASLACGDIVRVPAGAPVPADGDVVEGRSSVEEALLTGECWPRAKGPGDPLVAGSINRESPLVMRVQRAGDATTLAAIGRLVERAAAERPRVARLADRVASFFVAGLLAVAGIAALAWWPDDPQRAVAVAVAVLVVSCPCALSLATPAALACTAGALARRGVLIVRSDALEALARVTHVVLDKTGTLTSGRVRLLETVATDGNSERCREIAGALEQGSAHPIGRAIAASAWNVPAARDVVAFQGRGVEGSVGGVRYRLGTPAWVAAFRNATDEPIPSSPGNIVVALGTRTRLVATLRLGDTLRDDACSLVAALRAAGLRVSILSGDRAANVAHVAAAVGVASWRAEATPQDKRAHVAMLQRNGAVVAMAGDGINDAPSLACADVSIAHGSAAPFTQWTADVVVPGGDLGAIGFTLGAARRTFRVIRENVAWALVYNAVAIPLAATGHLTPLVAAAGMSASSLFVVANALRLARVAPAAATPAHDRSAEPAPA